MSSTLLQKVNAGFAAALILLVVIAFIASVNAERLVDDTRLVQRTHDSLAGLGDVLRGVLDAESAQRAYHATGQAEHLTAHAAAAKSLPDLFARARDITRDSEEQRTRFNTLQDLVQQRMALLEESLRFAGPGLNVETRRVELAKTAALLSRRIRSLASELTKDGQARLAELAAAGESRAHRTVYHIALTGGFAVVLVLLASWLVHRDFSARQTAEAQAHRAFTLLDETRDGLFIYDLENLRFSYVNHGAVEQTGFPRGELLRMTAIALETEYGEGDFVEKIFPLVCGTEQSLTYTTRHRRRDGTQLPVEILLQCITLPGAPRSFVALVRDVTERQKADEEIRRLNADLERRVLDLLTKISAHKMRLPGSKG